MVVFFLHWSKSQSVVSFLRPAAAALPPACSANSSVCTVWTSWLKSWLYLESKSQVTTLRSPPVNKSPFMDINGTHYDFFTLHFLNTHKQTLNCSQMQTHTTSRMESMTVLPLYSQHSSTLSSQVLQLIHYSYIARGIVGLPLQLSSISVRRQHLNQDKPMK